MPDWITEEGKTVSSRQDLAEQLRAEQESNLILTEAMVDLEMALEDVGWRKLAHGVKDEFSPEGRRRIREMCRLMVVSNPLIKRGVTVRIGYIWGQGVQVAARSGEDAKQNVDEVVQMFWDDNTASLTGSQAQEELERALGSDGEVYLALFTNPLVGRVQVRSTPTDEIVDIICNPEDRDEPWFYIREYVTQVLEQGYALGNTRTRAQTVKVAHPALGFRPSQRIKTLNGAEVRWDAPILHIPVNRLDGWKYGIPDVYASIAWARMYRDFLVDWALVVKSLSKFVWKATGGTKSRAQTAAAAIKANAERTTSASGVPAAPPVGQAAVAGPGTSLEAIPKTGATIDAESGKPLAGMAAAGLGLPVTILLADPGITGARATAETLDVPTILEMTMRRVLWATALDRILQHAIDAAVEAPRGTLRGTATIDVWGRKVITLAGDTDRTVEIDWPPLIDIDPVELIKAIVEAEGTQVGQAIPLTMLRLLLKALGVKNPEEVIDEVTDEDGNFVDPRVGAGQVAADAFRRGEDPAAALA
jgi:hypothetical protein